MHVRVRGRRRLSPRGAALDALRVHAGDRAPGQRRRHAEPARVLAARGRVARPAGGVPVPVVDCRLRPARPRRRSARAGRVNEDAYNTPTTMYGCNKLYCEQLGRYYAGTTSSCPPTRSRASVDFRCVRFPGLISALTRALGRHVGLRAGDDSRRREGRAVCLLRAAGHPHPVHGHAGRRRCAAAAGGGATGAR